MLLFLIVMSTLQARIEPGNKIVLPSRVLKELNVEEGNGIEFRVENGAVQIVPSVHERVQRLQERMKKYIKPGHSIVDELIAERRAEAEKE